MPRIFLTLLLLLALAAPVLADGDYRYYEVRPGDTVDSVAAAHGLEPSVVLRCNASQILEGKGLVPGRILVLPAPPSRPAPAASSTPQASPSPAKDTVQAASPARKPRRTAAAPGPGRLSASGGTLSVHGTPSFRNRYVSSDGRALEVPAYVPPVEPADEEEAASTEPGRQTLASRSGRPIRGVLAAARRFLGVPYVWGGEDPSGFDCSGYVQYVYRMHGVPLPRTADIQFNAGRAVPRGQEQPGDLVFFETYAPGASHVGIYLGGGSFIHASSVGFVRISSLGEDYFQARYLGARRVL